MAKKVIGTVVGAAALTATITIAGFLPVIDSLIAEAQHRELHSYYESFLTDIEGESQRAAAMADVVATMPEVQRAMASRDRAALDRSFTAGFAALQAAQDVEQFQFHLPPATSFFRVHQPQKFGDDLSSFRKMVVQANETRKPVTGIETGVAGLGIRGVIPIEANGTHVGTIEFGTRFGQSFFDRFKRQHGVDVSVKLVAGDKIQTIAETMHGLAVFDDAAIRGVVANGQPVTKALHQDGPALSVMAAPVHDFSGHTIGVVQIAVDDSFYTGVRSTAHWIAVGIAFSAMLLAGLVGFAIIRPMCRCLAGLTTVMKRLAGGETDLAIPGLQDHSELGAMAHSVQVFKQAAIDKLRIEAEAAEHRQVAERERTVSEAGRAKAAESQALVVAALAQELGRLSKGDLTFRLTQLFPPAYEGLRTDYNSALSQMHDAMAAIAGNTTTIRSTVGEIATAADDLSRRTEHQAASLEQTAAAMNEMTVKVRQTAEGALQARAVVSKTKADAERSSEVVRSTVTAMAEIEASSRQIEQIVSVIDEIAFQTNLLALNAGVEAARAGETGRGFAVVATEVRGLAQRAAHAAKDITALITASTQQVLRGVRLVGDTGDALGRIASQVAEIDGVVHDITMSAQEQAAGLQQINTAVLQMDQVTQQNAAVVQESAAAVHALLHETHELGRRTAHFRLQGLGAADESAAWSERAPLRKRAGASLARER